MPERGCISSTSQVYWLPDLALNAGDPDSLFVERKPTSILLLLLSLPQLVQYRESRPLRVLEEQAK